MNTHADKTQENKSRTNVNKVSQKQVGSEPAFQFSDNRPETAVQRKLQAVANNSEYIKKAAQLKEIANNSVGALKIKSGASNQSSKQTSPIQQKEINSETGNHPGGNTEPVIQLAKKNVIVTGVSHLVKMNKKSLHASETEKEIHHGQELVIETSSKIKSRRGPNQEDYKVEDAEGEHIYNWYQVISLEGKPVGVNFYVREDVFVEVTAEKSQGKIVKGFGTANTVVNEITKVPATLIGNEGITGVADALNDKTVFTKTSGGPGASTTDKMHAKNMGIAGDSITGVTGLLAMANGFVRLGDPEATTADLIERVLEIEQGAMKTGEAISKLAHTASGSNDATTASKFGSAFEGYGAAFAGIKEAFVGMRKLVNLINEYQDYSTPEKAKAAGEISVHALETAKSIVLSVKAFIELVEGSASGHLMAAVPGLDIAISGGKIIMQAYYLIISNNSRKEMNDRRNELTNNDPEEKGKMKEASKNYRKYDAVISNKKKVLKKYEKELANPGKKTDVTELKKKIKRLKREIIQLEQYNPGVSRDEAAEFTLATELRDANRKRVTRQGIHIATEMAKIAGAIATLSGVGAMGGGIVKGAAAATDLALPVARLAKQKARDSKAKKRAKADLNEDQILQKGKFYHVDASKSSVAKYDFRIKQVKYLIKLIVDLAYKNPETDGKDFENVQRYLKAAGVNKKKLYASNGNPQKQISILLDAFQQREL